MSFKTELFASAVVLSMALSSAAFADPNEVDDGNGNAQDSTIVSLDNILNGSLNDNAADSYSDDDSLTVNKSDDDFNGASMSVVIANQYLAATNNNSAMDELVDMDGQDETDSPVGYNSGDNYVRGNAFSAFAGILTAAWNTGINANTQAATNIAAQGTVNFGANAGCCTTPGGGTGGGDD
jgi:hypothetical protein